MDLKKIVKELRDDLFYQIESKFGAEKANNYPSIKKADKAMQQINLSLGDVVHSLRVEPKFNSGWHFDYNFLDKVSSATQKYDYGVGMEEVEIVLRAISEFK